MAKLRILASENIGRIMFLGKGFFVSSYSFCYIRVKNNITKTVKLKINRHS